ncbi:MAG: hypothetical protein NC120_09135, partial [Ruminococcus sp.]|nr:hypothetical protein [Ruminococcus sp.]
MSGEKLALISGVCIFAAAMCRLFDSGAKEYSVMIKTAAAAAIAAAVLAGIVPVLDRIEQMYARTGGDSAYFTVLLKSLGICFLTGLAADICRDSGE